MHIKFISNESKIIDISRMHRLGSKADIIALILIATVIILSSISPLTSYNKINHNDDFYQSASRHEAFRKAVLEYHTFPLRSFWFGGGYPTLGDPEDPSLNPLTLLTLIFGTVTGLKIISFLTMLIGGLSTYALARYILGYTQWGALFSGLIFSLSLLLPFAIHDGDYNDIYPAFLPLCLLLIGLACQGRKAALLILSFVFYTMLSDGKQMALMVIFYIGILCIVDVMLTCDIFVKSSSLFNCSGSSNRSIEKQMPLPTKIKPIKIFVLALIVTFFTGMLRFLPAFDLIGSKGGLGHVNLLFHTNVYPDGFDTYTLKLLMVEIIGSQNVLGRTTVGWLPVVLSLIAILKFRKQSIPWFFNFLLFGWLILAYNAPIDLFKLLRNLPIFSSIYQPWKYFNFPLVFTLAIIAGQAFWLLKKMRSKKLESLLAVVLIILGTWSLYFGVIFVQNNTYKFVLPTELLVKENDFYSIQGKDLVRNRKKPLNSITYINLIRNVGTIDWHTGMPIDENAVPKYFVDAEGQYFPNFKYRGEAYFVDSKNLAKATFRPNSIIVQVNVLKPDTLIVNQNYHRDWHTDHGKIFEKDGLISLRLNKAGSYKVTMRYISRSFFIGLVVSLISLIILIFICWSYKTGRLMKWSLNAPVHVRWMPRFILWLID